ncbi:Carboxylic ester hydrolase [Paramyrothecium foliicola]|nr:Carboxylic ester hydrolase [Paramyrothecium foliicola]
MRFHRHILITLCLSGKSFADTDTALDATNVWPLNLLGNVQISAPTGKTIRVQSPAGTVIGAVSKVETFYGIPFADSTVNSERLKPPKRRSKPLVDFDATAQAKSCPQFGSQSTFQSMAKDLNIDIKLAPDNSPIFLTNSADQTEDCLTVTIQRPLGTEAGAKLPVFFWIYGGGFASGGTSMFNAEQLLLFGQEKAQDFVSVAVNYRVGGFGFLGGAEIKANGSSNLGLLDQRMGLEWVADNIEAFGGDPRKVTIAGESAGSISVFDQMLLFDGDASYKGNKLFRGAIMSSGSAAPVDPIDSPRAQDVYDGVVSRAGCSGSKDTLQCLRECDFGILAAAINGAPSIISYNSLALAYLPRQDGVVLPDRADIQVKEGRYHAVPVLIGNQEDEGTFFSWAQKNITDTNLLTTYFHETIFANATRQQTADFVGKYPEDSSAGSPFRTGNLYDDAYNGAEESVWDWTCLCYKLKPRKVPGYKRMAAILGDLVFTLSRRLAVEYMVQNHEDVPVWSWLNSYLYKNVILGKVGTAHGLDLLVLFMGGLGDKVPLPVASARTYWINFLHNQDPNSGGGVGRSGEYPTWPLWKDAHKLLWFNLTEIGTRDDNFRDSSYQYMKANASFLVF